MSRLYDIPHNHSWKDICCRWLSGEFYQCPGIILFRDANLGTCIFTTEWKIKQMFYLQHVIRLNNSFGSDYIPRYWFKLVWKTNLLLGTIKGNVKNFSQILIFAYKNISLYFLILSIMLSRCSNAAEWKGI